MKRQDFVIEAEELLARQIDGNIRLYDASLKFFAQPTDATPFEDYQQSHIPGAAFFDHLEFSNRESPYEYAVLGAPELFQSMERVGISNDSEVVVYANMLPSATRAAWVLRYAGHDKVRILNGGLPAWVKAGGELEQGVRRYPTGHFVGQLRPGMMASTTEVQAALEDSNARVVNTLMQSMFEQGHIPGSTLLSALDLMFDMSSFRSNEALAQRLDEELQGQRIITYCGGGIAATVNAMAHLLIGNDNVAVYDGSMYEWIGEGLPVATGAN